MRSLGLRPRPRTGSEPGEADLGRRRRRRSAGRRPRRPASRRETDRSRPDDARGRRGSRASLLDNAELGELTSRAELATAVALIDQQLPRRVLHQRRLLFLCLDRDEPHVRPRRRLRRWRASWASGLAAIPKDPPPRSTLYDYFDLWSWNGTLDRVHDALYAQCRQAASREASPTAAIIDSQSAKSAEKDPMRVGGGRTW